jgi:hypothetical protein
MPGAKAPVEREARVTAEALAAEPLQAIVDAISAARSARLAFCSLTRRRTSGTHSAMTGFGLY